MGLTARLAAYAAALAWMLAAPGQQHRLQFAIAMLLLPWAASTALLWIGRPAADAVLPEITSRRAIAILAAGALSAAFTGWHGLLLLAVAILAVRAALALCYQRWGGIRATGLQWLRDLLALAVLLIARLPEASLWRASN